MIITPYDWNQYFITMAYLVSMQCKDQSTRVGAVIVGQSNEIRSTGYNGFPRGIKDYFERYSNKDYKHAISNHAEENAILHCVRIGVSTSRCTLYTTWRPCASCARMIIQSGISRVIFHEEFPGNYQSKNWLKSMQIGNEILNEANIEVVAYSGNIITIQGLYDGENFDLK